MLTIYHNPRCSKSRSAVQYLEENNHHFEVVEYLKTPPTKPELVNILAKLKLDIRDIIRTKEPEYKEHNLNNDNLSDDEIVDVLISTPKLIERPIIISNNNACIARPIDNLINMLND